MSSERTTKQTTKQDSSVVLEHKKDNNNQNKEYLHRRYSHRQEWEIHFVNQWAVA